jgi:hypothetical protein
LLLDTPDGDVILLPDDENVPVLAISTNLSKTMLMATLNVDGRLLQQNEHGLKEPHSPATHAIPAP